MKSTLFTFKFVVLTLCLTTASEFVWYANARGQAKASASDDAASPFVFSQTMTLGLRKFQGDELSNDVVAEYALFTAARKTSHQVVIDAYGTDLEVWFSFEEFSDSPLAIQFKKDKTLLLKQKEDIDKQNEIHRQSMQNSLLPALDKTIATLKDKNLTLEGLEKIVADARHTCETYNSFSDLLTSPAEKVALFCEENNDFKIAKANCLQNPFQYFFDSEQYALSKTEKTLMAKEAEATSAAKDAVQRILISSEAKSDLLSIYRDVTSDPRGIADSDVLKDELAFLSASGAIQPTYLKPFIALANAQGDRENKSGNLAEIKKMQLQLEDEYDAAGKISHKNNAVQTSLAGSFFTLNNCAHDHMLANDFWDMDGEAKKLLTKWEIARAPRCQPHANGIASSKRAGAAISDKLSQQAISQGKILSGLSAPEEYIREQRQNGTPLTASEINQLMASAALRTLSSSPGDSEDVSLRDPDFFKKIGEISSLASTNMILRWQDYRQRSSLLDSSDMSVEGKNARLTSEWELMEIGDFERKKFSEINGSALVGDSFPQSDYIKKQGGFDKDGNQTIDIRYDLPGVDPLASRRILVTFDISGSRKIEYFEDGKRSSLPVPNNN